MTPASAHVQQIKEEQLTSLFGHFSRLRAAIGPGVVAFVVFLAWAIRRCGGAWW
jgi:hypothetical protein